MIKPGKIIVIVLVLVLLIASGYIALTDMDETPESTPSSSDGTTLPSISMGPSTSTRPSTAATEPSISNTEPSADTTPETTPPELAHTGYSFVYDGSAPFYGIDPDCSECTVGHLYWVDKTTEEVTLLLAEQVSNSIDEGSYVYYVKEAGPTKIFRVLISDPSQHELVHETAYGKVSDLTIYPGIENYLQFVADNKKFVVFEFDTGVETVLMEQYYISIAYIYGADGALGNAIWFEGKHTEEDSPYDQFWYDRDTGETKEDTSL